MFGNAFSNCLARVDGKEVATLKCIPDLLPVIITVAITFAFIVSLILIIYSGVKFITSGGDEKQVEGAKKTLTYSIIGLIVVLSSFFIVQLIARQTGVGCLTNFGFETCKHATNCTGARPTNCDRPAVCDTATRKWVCPAGGF